MITLSVYCLYVVEHNEQLHRHMVHTSARHKTSRQTGHRSCSRTTGLEVLARLVKHQGSSLVE